jgi:hypothetical protein
MMCKRQGKSLLKLDPSCFNSELFFVRTHMYVRTQKYVDTYCIRLSNYITPNSDGSAQISKCPQAYQGVGEGGHYMALHDCRGKRWDQSKCCASNRLLQ